MLFFYVNHNKKLWHYRLYTKGETNLFDWFCTFFMLEGKNGCGGTDKEHTDCKLANSGSCIVTNQEDKSSSP